MIAQGLTTIFKANCLSALEDFTGTSPYVYKLALYTANATLNATTTTYTSDNEISGTGYPPGGIVIYPIAPLYDLNAGVAYVSFNNVTISPASFTCRGGLIYNSTTNAAVAVLDFGNDKTATGTFTITFPTDDAANAIIRFA